MRKFLYSAGLAVVAFGLIVSPAQADLLGEATKHVYVTVEPDVAVGGSADGSVDAGSIQRGEIIVNIPFRVDANKEQVTLYVDATPLWKGDDPTNNEVEPIYVCGFATYAPTNANPLAGGTNIAFGSVLPDGTEVMGLPSSAFTSITFESSQNGHFSQDVDVEMCWNQDQFEKPMGEYSGYVKLTAVLDPLSP